MGKDQRQISFSDVEYVQTELINRQVDYENGEGNDEDLLEAVNAYRNIKQAYEEQEQFEEELPPSKLTPHAKNKLSCRYSCLCEIAYAEGSKVKLNAIINREDAETRLGGNEKIRAIQKTLKNLPFDEKLLHDTACRMCSHSDKGCPLRYSYRDIRMHDFFTKEIVKYGLDNWRKKCLTAMKNEEDFKCSDILPSTEV